MAFKNITRSMVWMHDKWRAWDILYAPIYSEQLLNLSEKDRLNKSANSLALCHRPSASFCSVLAGQWSSLIFTHDRYNILSDILIECEVNLGIIIEKYAKT